MTAGTKLGFVRTPLSTAAMGGGMFSTPFYRGRDEVREVMDWHKVTVMVDFMCPFG